MGERFLIDTNVVIYTLEGSLPSGQKPIIASIIDDELNISSITHSRQRTDHFFFEKNHY